MKLKELIPKNSGWKNSYYESIYSRYKDEILEYEKPDCFVCGKKVNCITEDIELTFHITCFNKVKKYYDHAK